MSGQYSWLAGHMGGPGNPYQRALQTVAAIVGECEGTEMIVSHSGTLGSEEEMLQMLLTGRQQAMVGTSSSLRRLCPELLMCDLPFLFQSRPQFYLLSDHLLQPAYSNRLLEKGVRLLAMMEGGWRDLFNARRPIHTPADMGGLRMRTMDNPVHQAAIEALGAVPVVLSTQESYRALQTGAIDGGDRAAYNYMDYGYQKAAPYYCKIGIFMVASYLILSEEWFQSLSQETRGKLLSAAVAIAQRERDDYCLMDGLAYEAMVRENITITRPDREAFRIKTEVVWEPFLVQTESAGLLQQIKAWKV